MNLTNLSVFELNGTGEQISEVFLPRIGVELCRRNLLSIVVSSAEAQDIKRLYTLINEYDLVFIDGKTDLAVQRIAVFASGEAGSESEFSCNPGNKESMAGFYELFFAELARMVRQTPVWACILIGGKSSRMGQPKHLLKDDSGNTWLERTVELLTPLVEGIAISGAGKIPGSLSATARLVDVPGVVGPVTGLLSATRWQPQVSWLLVACDMPQISQEAVDWLLADRLPGCWANVPRLAESSHFEPLFAWYDKRAAQIIEKQVLAGVIRIGRVARHPKVACPVIPPLLSYSWENVNTPAQLKGILANKTKDL